MDDKLDSKCIQYNLNLNLNNGTTNGKLPVVELSKVMSGVVVITDFLYLTTTEHFSVSY